MLIKDHYAALGASYSTLFSIKHVFKFQTIDEAYQFWMRQKELKQQKKAELSNAAKQLGISERSVKMRMYRREKYKIDETVLESKWLRFEYNGVTAGFFTHCKNHNANADTARRHYNKHGDFVAAMNHAISTRKQREAKNG